MWCCGLPSEEGGAVGEGGGEFFYVIICGPGGTPSVKPFFFFLSFTCRYFNHSRARA
jgi:hypothetical protein